MGFKSCVKLGLWSLFVLGLSAVAIHYWLNNKSYLLDDQTVAWIAEKYVGKFNSTV